MLFRIQWLERIIDRFLDRVEDYRYEFAAGMPREVSKRPGA